MASVIKAGNATDGVQVTSDNTGILELKTGTGAGTTAMTLDASQNVGIGTSSPTNLLSVAGNANFTGNVTLGDASTDTVTVNGYMGVGGAGVSQNALNIISTGLTGSSACRGVNVAPTFQSGATSSGSGVVSAPSTAAASFTMANMYSFAASNGTKGAGSTITNQYGFQCDDLTRGDNIFGFSSAISSGANKWNIYASGTAQNYFAGNVGIGTSTINTTLAVNGNALIGTGTWPTSAVSRTGSRVALSSSTEDGVLIVTNMQSGVALGRAGTIYLGARATTGVEDSTFATVNGIKENATSGNYASALTFGTSASNGTITEKARITSGGDLLLNSTNATTATMTIMARSGGSVVGFRRNSSTYGSDTQVGSISCDSTSTAYNTSSDYRLKENIQPMTGALAKLAALKPCTYTWKEGGSDGEGFIAHELQEIVPQCVTGEKDAVDAEGNPIYQGVDTSFLVATLTAAIQELKAELDATKAEIAALKGAAQ